MLEKALCLFSRTLEHSLFYSNIIFTGNKKLRVIK